MKKILERGHIIRINFDPALSAEIKDTSRPALVISSKDFHHIGFAMICPITHVVKQQLLDEMHSLCL